MIIIKIIMEADCADLFREDRAAEMMLELEQNCCFLLLKIITFFAGIQTFINSAIISLKYPG